MRFFISALKLATLGQGSSRMADCLGTQCAVDMGSEIDVFRGNLILSKPGPYTRGSTNTST